MSNYVLLQSATLRSSATSLSITNIPQSGYKDLKLVVAGRDSGDDLVRFSIGINSFSKTTLTRNVMYSPANNTIYASDMSSNTSIGYGTVRSTGTANTYGNMEIYFADYLNTDTKTISVYGLEENNSADAIMSIGGAYYTGGPIKIITLLSDAPYLAAGTTMTLYGIKDASNVVQVTPKATGGDVIANDGEYWYHAFTSTGVFKPLTNLNCDYMVVGGGGGGGRQNAGGGGAGGVVSGTSTTFVNKVNYLIGVGAGGAAPSGSSRGGNGGASGISGGALSISAAGGGGGGGGNYNEGYNGYSGGSGGGGGGTGGNGAGGSATSGQGYAGGQSAANYSGGGGGGAGGAGSNATGQNDGGTGGVGISTFSSWAYATQTGDRGYFAGGGAGMNGEGSNGVKSGGLGGGGNGSNYNTNGTDGTVNTGGGGGGSQSTGTSGGSGIVIIRYAMA